ncbi:MAG: 3-dehydroquinate synthase family protein, partial [Acidimicrobiia bacterium]
TLCRQFAARGLLRDDAVIALGGGVVGDIAGFAAAIYHRGIAVHQVPTSLLAMVDSSVGGKTGVNLPEGKNLIGAFHQPASVTIDPLVLATLPEREYVAGLGEIAKYALMGPQFDAAYGLDSLVRSGSSSLRSRDTGLLTRVIHGCVQLKADVVMDDPLEQSGRRASLNYGHTLGHALEIETHHELLHGEAIAIGLIFAAELACALGLLSLEATDRHYEIVSSLGLPTNAPSGCDAGRIVSLMKRDKKAAGGLTFMLRSGDDMKRVDDPPASAIAGALERVGITATHSAHDAGER